MIQRVLGWVAALGALNPCHADFQKNGWTPVYREGHALMRARDGLCLDGS